MTSSLILHEILMPLVNLMNPHHRHRGVQPMLQHHDDDAEDPGDDGSLGGFNGRLG